MLFLSLSLPDVDSTEMDRLKTVPRLKTKGDDQCYYCGNTDCAGHPQEDAQALFALGKFSGSVSMDDGDDPCPYCGSTDCSGHDPEDAGSSGSGKMARWVAMRDELRELAVMAYANILT